MKTNQKLLAAAVVLLFVGGCGKKIQPTDSRVTIAVEGDVDGFNPLFAEDVVSGEINDLIFPRLVDSDFDEKRGQLAFTPFLAKSWEMSADNRDITFHLRTDVKWSDGVSVTARDVQFSFELYGDTAVASVRQSIVQNLVQSNPVERINDSTVVFHFKTRARLFDIGVPLLPAHVFETIPRKELRTNQINKLPVTCGPFALARWNPMQEVILASSSNFGTSFTPKISRLVFKVLPEYRTRIAQLESGEVDIATGLRVEDTDLPSRNPNLKIISTVGRDYDFLGWNNIDPSAWSKSSVIRPHALFGSVNVRRALTMAINRNEIVRAYLKSHGTEAVGGVSPLFRWAFNDTLKPLLFDKAEASALLTKEGWRDADGDGILERGGKKFSFALRLASGNQLRDVIATVVQQQLKDVKIEMKIEQVERGAFWNDMMQRKYDAFFAGFSVPMQMHLEDLWGGDLKKYPFNLAGFRNTRVDEILASAETVREETDNAALWKEFQTIVHNEQPYTLLFWIHNIVGVNTRLSGTHIGILGTTHRAWEWNVTEAAR